MIINDNGISRRMTDAEKMDFDNAVSNFNVLENSRPCTKNELFDRDIKLRINNIKLTANDSIAMKEYYPEFDDLVEICKDGKYFDKGYKFRYKGELFATVQTKTRFEAQYPPGEGTESLYEKLCESHIGTLLDPIDYTGNIKLEQGLYYEQYGLVYLCYNSAGNAAVQHLNELETFVRRVYI